ncbi:ABC transporter ATP-binding protein (plasmid) [Deinococcus metallilatus]|uniref:Branched-chain amino acid transport system ATP-binding protein n=1 Tax=Deinococcus metallilatus TaxID=1211322 RepID=A0ABR6MNR4_9DEIO|nr:ABC transporter ATP-binding protein [Deinococcus metallilatus]MBB5293584.1 branched-chain amino acid transport system ATP-binding protein [Deinococcus metallilatus]QBY06651.1 ABC transporter ATP-binding protein [Deinococcus metallilatus]RXJ17994.1 ABC transporter ATP-binding protein [Deinococcus metallilatus]GMA15196.1 ABC transporter ATP-binding protein [Deinococcus metallilatus]
MTGAEPQPRPLRPQDAPLLLEVRDLHTRYGRVEALDGVSLQVPAGHIVSVIGANGAGKTTLMNSIMGVLPSSGEIIYRGQSLKGVPLEARVARGISLVPERRDLFASMTVQDNLQLGAYSRRRENWRADLENVYARFPRLLERRTQLAGTLSGGEQQMLAIGRALMGKPRLLLLDEPSLGLAPLIVRDILRIVQGLKADGVTVLLVEQNARASLAISDEAYVLETGQVKRHGPAAELARDQTLGASYLGA